jgi:hypothetical protein
MKKTRRRMGRPRLAAAKRRRIGLTVCVTKAERRMLEAEAAKCGLTVSELFMKPWR